MFWALGERLGVGKTDLDCASWGLQTIIKYKCKYM